MEEVKGVVFDIAGELNPGAWFEMDGGGRICLRVCAGDDIRSINKQTTKKKIEYKNGQRYPTEEVDEELRSALMWDYCIVAWEKLLMPDSSEIPCTKENKIKLMGKSLKFSKFVLDSLNTLADDLIKVEVSETKN